MGLHKYEVIGRSHPTETNTQPKIYRMNLFAKNEVVAASRFWYFLKRLPEAGKTRKNNGEIVSVRELFEKKPSVIKNFGISIRYNSRSGIHNMYKEYRDTTEVGAVEQMYNEMAGRHRARFGSIHILNTTTVKAADCRRNNTTQFHNSTIKFPLARRIQRAPSKKLRAVFTASRPTTHN